MIFMIIIADSIKKIDFSQLAILCVDEVEQIRKERFRSFEETKGYDLASEEFYFYLCSSFFPVGGLYFVYEENGRYISSVRFDPYEDGYLLNALCTASDVRRKGHGTRLVEFAFMNLYHSNIYSHVSERNVISRKFHEKLEFSVLHNYARMLDGSVRNDHLTYIRKL